MIYLNLIFLLILLSPFSSISLLIKYKNHPKSPHYIVIIRQYIASILGNVLFESYSRPKITVVSPMYNTSPLLPAAIRSIQKQSFKSIEIIFVDDGSKDNSTDVIKEEQKIDKRIRLVLNGRNRGCVYTRANGVLSAKGDYIIPFDSDDVFINGKLFEIVYGEAVKNDVGIVNFQSMGGTYDDFGYFQLETKFNEIITQPYLSLSWHYTKEGHFALALHPIWGNLIKREDYLNALKIMTPKYYNYHIVFNEDRVHLYSLFIAAKSRICLSVIGNLYYANPNSVMHTLAENKKLSFKQMNDTINFARVNYHVAKDTPKHKLGVMMEYMTTGIFINPASCCFKNNYDLLMEFLSSKYLTKELQVKILSRIRQLLLKLNQGRDKDDYYE